MGKVIGVIAIKGGVGKTSAVTSLGASLARDFNKKVLVIDANFSAPNLALHIGMINPEITIHHVLDGKAKAHEAIYETEHGFDIIPGSLIYEKVNPLALGEKIRDLRRRYDIILIDSSPNLNEEILSTMVASDELLVVTTPDIVTLSATLRAVKLAKERKTPIIGLILNKVYNKNFELPLEDIEKSSGVSVLAVLPHELNSLEALSKSIPSTLHKNTPATKEYRKLAGSLIGEDYKEKKGRFMNKLRLFMKNVPKQDVNRTILKENKLRSYAS
jgi:MinD-like ATPase involved in chromosome partitioning or flagellar assembly